MKSKGQIFFPFRSENSGRFPLIVVSLIIINIVVFVLELTGEQITVGVDSSTMQPIEIPKLIHDYGFVPAQASLFTALTSMFLHADPLHIFFNMWFLWIFGDNLENKLGKVFFPIFYLISGFLGTFVLYLTDPLSTIPTIGASGAISGVLGAYIIFFPQTKIKSFGLPPFWGIYNLNAYLIIGVWFVFQLIFGILLTGESGIAYFAHIGGFVSGLLIAKFYLLIGSPKIQNQI